MKEFNMPSRRTVLVVFVLLSSAFLATSAVAQGAVQPKAGTAAAKVTAIRAETLIDGVAARARHNVLIVIKATRLKA
jgi:hypothetical protein